ncbi:hypothetical protein KCG44_07145 [Pacificimonas sp. WHA3]|uniref:DUF883 domain-containing protein n=1 Tax=Pacificimonas pallii TaxID=2827236 RepID=A0ABS6SDS9_9SPHN|nr:hypothetical protein [Pacificimonas pallii]MBV7256559.1 hypothetical protein [Pacificimonas pallii]
MTNKSNMETNGSEGRIDRAKGTILSAAETVKGKAGDARDYTADQAKAAKDYSAEKYAAARDYSADRYSKAREYSKARYDAAREYGAESWQKTQKNAAVARERTAKEIEASPLVAAGIGLIAGAALGFLLPRTRQENRTIGGLRDGLFDQASAAARAAKDAGLERADELGVKDQAKAHLTDLKDQAVDAAKTAASAAKSEASL